MKNARVNQAEIEHQMKISKQISFAKRNLPFYGSILLHQNHSCSKIKNTYLPGLFQLFELENNQVKVVVTDGNTKIGQKIYYLLLTDIESITVDKDINFKIIMDNMNN